MTWLIIRGSGLAAFGLLAASTIWGLLVSSGFLARLVKAKALTYMHESLAIGAILATFVHLAALSMDQFVEFGWRELFVPGASNIEPMGVAFGIIALYSMIIVSASFYVRKHIGQKAWRYIHFGSFGIYLATAVHGLMTGTDSPNHYVQGLYIGSTAIVIALTAVRVAAGGAKSRPQRPVRPTGTASEANAA
ncbi:MAG: ferric reductase-like transmembrane domain-containing protein [Acidimicrobiia bacterium]|nr:ferric reductase-like transmembrane domain-containing protein [Acidimicrobiia bacterium]